MSFDSSRFLFDPTHDYLGVVMQQGRVQLDADWNEWLAQLARRLQAGTLDLVGRSGVPAATPSGFRINAFFDTANPPQPHLTIGAGRIYVDGLLAENHGPAATQFQWDPALAEFSAAPQLPNVAEIDVDYTLQPYLPGLTVPSAQPTGRQFLVYLDVWQRDISALQDPTLIDPTVGIDTTARRQTVWQVKLLDITGQGVTAATPDALVSSPANPDLTFKSWPTLLQGSGALLTTGTGGAQTTAATACALTPLSGYTGLENQLYRVEIHQVTPATATAAASATFKWSRENASVATLVTAIATLATNGASQLTVQTLGRDQVLGFNPGDWIELTDDVIELSGQSGELHRITSIDIHARTVTLDSAVSTTKFPLNAGATIPARHTRILRWDQAGAVYFSDGSGPYANLDDTGSSGILVPPSGTTLLIESGITVAFDLAPTGGFFQPGDFWTFAARTADSSVQTLTRAMPHGPHHHFARLATVDFSATPPSVLDCRCPIPALANPALHVKNVIVGSNPLANDATVTIQSLVTNGISIVCDAPLDPAIINHPPGAAPATQPNNPICTVSLDLPAPANGGAFTRVILPCTLSFGPANTLQWKHAIPSAAITPFENQIPLTGPAILARLSVKGSAIWAAANPSIFLNGANNGRPSADFDLWFWLISQPVATISVNSLQFGVQPVGATPSQLTFTLFNNSVAAPLGIKSISIASNGSTPANSGFTQTNTFGASIPAATPAGPSSGSITVFFNPPPFTPPVTGNSTAQLNIVFTDNNIAPLALSLSGTAIAPSLLPSPGSLIFPTNTIVNATSAPLTLQLSSNGSSPVSISGITVVPVAGAAFILNQFRILNPPNFPINLLPEAVTGIQVTFTPVTAGSFAAQLSIASNASGSPLLIPITAGAIAGTPIITPSANALAFGTILVQASSTLTINFTNTGNTTLTISGVSTIGAQAGVFVAGINLTNLAPTQVATVTVTFRPTVAGAFAAQLQIVHNAAGSPLLIGLTGTGFIRKAKEGKEGKEIIVDKITDRKTGVPERLPQFRPAVLAAAETSAATEHAFITPAERPLVGSQQPDKDDPKPE